MITRSYRITGYVQGVGYRWFVVRTAKRLDVCGEVRNADDGSVEVVAVGEDHAVERLAEELARGPAGARVDRVARLDLADEVPPYTTFTQR